MKAWELEEGKEYKPSCESRCVYKIVNKKLLVRFDANEDWIQSGYSYNGIVDVDFTEYTPPIDWSKVKCNDNVLVKCGEKDRWVKRHFAKYDEGMVYTWVDGKTSFTASCSIPWKFAKLYTEGDDTN